MKKLFALLIVSAIIAHPAYANWDIETMQKLIARADELGDNGMRGYLMGYRDAWLSERMQEALVADRYDDFVTLHNECTDAWNIVIIAAKLSIYNGPEWMGFGLWWEYYADVSCPKLLELRRTYTHGVGEKIEVWKRNEGEGT